MNYKRRNTAIYSMWNPFFWLSVIFTTKEGFFAFLGVIAMIIKLTIAIWVILTFADMAQTLHDIHNTLMEIQNG